MLDEQQVQRQDEAALDERATPTKLLWAPPGERPVLKCEVETLFGKKMLDYANILLAAGIMGDDFVGALREAVRQAGLV